MLTIRQEIDRVLVEELCIEAPAPDTDLIATGLLDSLSIVTLLVELEQRFGVEVPLETLDLDAIRTVERLEATLAAAGGGKPPTRFLAQLKEGSGRPLFAIHDSHSVLQALQGIATALETDRPVYGIQPRGLFSDHADRTVESMAAAYVDAIRELQPTGPYVLIGNSFGGLVAFEMARRLEASGERIELLAMIDSQADAHTLPRPARLRFRIGAPLRRIRHILADRRTRVPPYLHRLKAMLPGEPRALPPSSSPLTPRIEDLKAIAYHAEDVYRPLTYPGDATLFLAQTRWPNKCSPRAVWSRKVQGNLSIVPVPGDHAQAMSGNLALIGATIGRSLAASDSAPPHGRPPVVTDVRP